MPRLSTLLELVGYGLAILFAIAVDTRLLIAEAAVAFIAVGTSLDQRK
jgi:hypothetical protein